MDFAADFTAIDFETANRRADSACQLAAVIVRQGTIVDQAMWMIRPEPFHFSRANIRIHGITPQQVQNEPNFAELWPDISKTIGDDCLVAHNANFDISVLFACLRRHRLPIPDLQFTCTRAVARRTWTQHRRYGLKPLSDWLGIRFRHHDALEDSIACAKILLAAGIDREATSLPDLEKRLRLRRGKAGAWGHTGPTGRSKPKRRPSDANPTANLPFLLPGQPTEDTSRATLDLQRLMLRAEFIRPLSGKRVVFSGKLRKLKPEQATALATRLGGTCHDALSDSTDILVVGTSEEAKTEETRIRTAGRPIEVVAEDEFIQLIVAET